MWQRRSHRFDHTAQRKSHQGSFDTLWTQEKTSAFTFIVHRYGRVTRFAGGGDSPANNWDNSFGKDPHESERVINIMTAPAMSIAIASYYRITRESQ
jgi:hypothetical protein